MGAIYCGHRRGGEDHDEEGWEPRTKRRPAFGARTNRKGRTLAPVTRKGSGPESALFVKAVGRSPLQPRGPSPNPGGGTRTRDRRGGNRTGPRITPSGFGSRSDDLVGYSESSAFSPAVPGPVPQTLDRTHDNVPRDGRGVGARGADHVPC